jgi:hypothetical protein
LKNFKKWRNKVLRVEIINALSAVENTIERICSPYYMYINLVFLKNIYKIKLLYILHLKYTYIWIFRRMILTTNLTLIDKKKLRVQIIITVYQMSFQ